MSPKAPKSPVREVRWAGQAAVVDVEGDIDLSRSAPFQQSLLELLDRQPDRIVVNLADVPYMDSSGVASLVKLLSRARRLGVPVFLMGLGRRVRSIFEITRLDSVFDICETEQEALS
jgi:anti-sigma B factor antagonist